MVISMKSERWQKIEEVFEAAAEREPQERAAYLDAACDGDTELRQEVESLLRHQTADWKLNLDARK